MQNDTPTGKDPQQVCAECLRKTKIGYAYRGGFFKHGLKGINHLEVGSSAIISNPITILAERLLVVFDGVRNIFQRVAKKLFPRREKRYGSQMDSALIGRITFAQREDEPIPIHHLLVEFWGRTWLGQWRKLSEGYTGEDGRFRLPFELKEARRRRIRKLRFEIYQFTHVYYNDHEDRQVHQRFKVIPVPKKDLIGMEYDLRTIPLFFWEYRHDVDLPRVVVKDHDKDAPQYYSQGRVDAIREQFIPIELTKVKHLEQIRLAPQTISLQKIQADYPENLTVCIEKELPGYTRSDEWFGKRMMNGMNRGYFMPDKKEKGMYWMKYLGKYGYDCNDEYALPDVAIKYRLRDDGIPMPVEIHLTGQVNAMNKDPYQHRVFTPNDGEMWQHAKRVARVNGGICTEVDEHFAGTHANTEQYAIAAYRNLRLNPLATLLFPHLKEVVLVNHTADGVLLKGYIPSASAFTYKGLIQRCKDVVGSLDWKGFNCMEPISEAHTYARAEQLFWDLTEEYVQWFIHQNIDGIKKYWYEIFCFSEDLVNHSVPVYLSDKNPEDMDERAWKRLEDMREYFAGQFCFDHGLPRERRKGVLRAVSPITKYRKFPEEHADEAVADLVKACTYMIFVATYLHTWANEHQYEDIGEILYNCLGLRYGEKESGILAPESDLGIAPDLTRGTQMMWFSNLLSRTEYGFITRNEELDINPHYRNLLLSKKEEFLALGVIVEDIESRTNI
ncbi:MAG TPA: lipoxygenase family protein [Phnomibacter sp.]|nr:lipoxygenase family protein [Phnomibacter sp.]